VETICVAFAFVIAITVGFELLVEGINHYNAEWASEIHANVLKEVVTKLYRELSILGFISFTLMMCLQSNVLSGHLEEVHAFEFAHVTMFFIALVFILQTVSFTWATQTIKSQIYSYASHDPGQIARLKKKWSLNSVKSLFTFSQTFHEISFYIMKSSFIVVSNPCPTPHTLLSTCIHRALFAWYRSTTSLPSSTSVSTSARG
jgi:hypothetical protein